MLPVLQILVVYQLLEWGMAVTDGVASQTGDAAMYMTNLKTNGIVVRIWQFVNDDVLLAVNEIEFQGISHKRAFEALKATCKSWSKAIICFMMAVHSISRF